MTIYEATSRLAAHCGKLFHSFSRCSPLPLHAFGITALLCGFLPLEANAAAISLNSDTSTATAGFFQLRWQANESTREFILYEAGSPNFSDANIVYQGTDLATVISGKADGQYFYRVTSASNPANSSDTVSVEVKHHPLSIAFSFFSVGAVVFLATLVLIFSARRTAG